MDVFKNTVKLNETKNDRNNIEKIEFVSISFELYVLQRAKHIAIDYKFTCLTIFSYIKRRMR